MRPPTRRVVRASVSAGLVLAAWFAIEAPAAYAIPTAVTETYEGEGHTLTYTLTGVTPDANDQQYHHTGTVTSQTVTLSGSATFVIGEGLVTNLGMGATLSVGDQSAVDTWPPEGVSGTVGNTTVTFPFSLTVTVPRPPTPDPNAWDYVAPTPGAPPVPYATLSFSVSSRNCNDWGVCSGPTMDGSFQVFPLTSTGTPSWVSAVGAAAAAAAAAAALAANGKPTTPDPNAPAGYVLQLNERAFRVGSETPATLLATAWRVDASGGMQPAPEAALRVEIPPGSSWLRVVPGEGAGSITGQISLIAEPTAEQATVIVVGSAPCGEISENVTVAVDMISDLQAELI